MSGDKMAFNKKNCPAGKDLGEIGESSSTPLSVTRKWNPRKARLHLKKILSILG